MIDCDPALYSYKTLKLLLQPLAENAIVHAVPLPNQKIFIHVTIYEEGGSLYLSVQDISLGMKQEEVDHLRARLCSPSPPDHRDSGYGLYNVNERIHVLFGSDFGLSIQSELNFGTQVTLKIPAITSKTEGDVYFVPSDSL